ncbi:helix-turn-helix transcriptional regulator [Ulvibacter antarcticus]|uniref:Regulatory LuxR family protein n=1 Tax=Ulvibacter antarcticus TaxID=442714 RepID=A0A3L9Y983_9FLAO|nr:hypothetical protein [Ulvibacter antarcticus]RMA57261.1 regulatory LuxR family protein [Ulvibacter antarcticus]
MKFKFLLFFVWQLTFFNVCAQRDVTIVQKHLDSSAAHVENNIDLSRIYLDSISNPSEATLGKKIAQYFFLKAKLHNEDYDNTGTIQNYMKSLKYAEKYKNYQLAAKSSGEISSKFYLLKKDSLADLYYEKAKSYYIKIDDEFGLLDLMQFPAYAKYVNFEMEESIALISNDLQAYKAVEDDKTYYCFAIYLLASNHLHLGNIDKAHEFYTIYQSLKGNKYLEDSYHLHYDNAIKSCFAEYYIENENLDSIKYYLDGIYLKSGSKDINVQKSLYNHYIKYYQLKGNADREKMYQDSLDLFNKNVLDNSFSSSLEGIEELSHTNLELNKELTIKANNKKYFFLLITGVVVLGILLLIYFKKIKKKEIILTDLEENYSNIKAKQEKLVVKNIELEEFLTALRKEIKRISSIESVSEQRKSIDKLYREIHIDHTNFVNSDDHFKLISTINEDFFLKIEKDYSQLDNLEVLICYYLYTGFKSKEIAVFADRSIRAIENKRYRISKKLGVDSNKESLKEFLDTTFKM